jgi:hypothetical protein
VMQAGGVGGRIFIIKPQEDCGTLITVSPDKIAAHRNRGGAWELRNHSRRGNRGLHREYKSHLKSCSDANSRTNLLTHAGGSLTRAISLRLNLVLFSFF